MDGIVLRWFVSQDNGHGFDRRNAEHLFTQVGYHGWAAEEQLELDTLLRLFGAKLGAYGQGISAM